MFFENTDLGKFVAHKRHRDGVEILREERSGFRQQARNRRLFAAHSRPLDASICR
jgi:hypothetical protein